MTYLGAISEHDLSLARSSLDAYGFCEIAGALSREGHERLRAEAVAQFDSAYYSSSRAGLEYEAYIADFGPAANGFLNSAAMQSLLEAVVRGRYALDSSKSCYTYYFGGGHLAPHLDDIPGQRPISVLTYLLAAGDGEHPDSGLNLDVYERMVPVPGARQCRIATRETSIVLGYGTEVWHGRRALRSEEKVIVMNGSYALRNDSHCNPAQ